MVVIGSKKANQLSNYRKTNEPPDEHELRETTVETSMTVTLVVRSTICVTGTRLVRSTVVGTVVGTVTGTDVVSRNVSVVMYVTVIVALWVSVVVVVTG